VAKKYVYYFGDGKAEGTSNMKELLGGKGAGLAEMTNLGISVPPGFTISTEACVEYYKLGKKYPSGMWEASLQALKRVERSMSMGFGDPERPLLVSVRSGARASMPGMMDTVLNVGLTTKTVEGLAAKTRNDRFAQDSYRRFVSMFGSIVMGVPREHFEAILKHKKAEVGVTHDTHLDARHLRELVASFKALVKEETKKDFPDEPLEQLRMAINAVFSSWFGARAITYRRLYGIPDSWGTAVNVVAMVFGNMGETSGTGVAFTRSPSSGDKAFFGECLMNAQGEDVVAGIRTPLPVSALAKNVPEAYRELEQTYKKLEKHYRDMLDLEFTIQEGKLYMLQTRVGKRTGIAAVRIAVDMVKEGAISREEAVQRVGPDQLAQYMYPIFDMKEESKVNPLGKGLPAGPGAAAGKIALTPDRAVDIPNRPVGVEVSRVVAARGRPDRQRERAGLRDHVYDAGDRIGAVLRRGSVPEDLDPIDHAGGQRVQVHTAGPRAHPGAEDVDERRVMASLAVDEDQRVVGREAAQGEGPHDVGRVGHALAGEVDGRRELLEDRARLGRRMAGDLFGRVHVDGDRQLVGRAVLGARADEDPERLHLDRLGAKRVVPAHLGALGHAHGLGLDGVADGLDTKGVRSDRNGAQEEVAPGVGLGPEAGALEAHGRAGDRLAVLIGDPALDRPGLGEGDEGKAEE